MAAQVPNIFVEQYDQGQKKIRADLMDENFAYVCTQLDANSDAGSAAQTAADNAQTAADNAQTAADAAQTTADGKVTAAEAANAAMPKPNSRITMSLPASGGSITAPADGYLVLAGYANASGQFLELDSATPPAGGIASRTYSSGVGQSLRVFIPVSSGDTVIVSYSTTAANALYFQYANGSAPTN